MVEKLDNFEKFIELFQRLIGGGLFVWMYINDRGVDLSTLTSYQIIFMIGQYAVAFALLKGFTPDEVIRVVKAFRGDKS